jgi:hypothetical protein
VDKVKQTKFKIENMFYFNFAAILGWYVNGNIFKKAIVNEGLMNFFDKIVPIFKVIEKYFLFHRLGISLIVVLTK